MTPRSPLTAAGPWLAVCGLAILWLLAFPPADALAYKVERRDEPVTGLVSMSPTDIDLNVIPADASFIEIAFTNRTGESRNLNIDIEDFTGSDDPSVSFELLGNEESPQGARDWLVPEVDSLVINHGETVTMRVDINAPFDAEPGGHYTALLASFSPVDAAPEGGVTLVSRQGCFFLMTVDGPVTEAGTLERPEVPGIFAGSGPVPLGLVFNNEGNIHLKPTGTVKIRNLLGMTVAEMPVNEFVVMPGSSRRAELNWDSRFLLGPYTVEADLRYGSDPQQVIASSRFWGFSWMLLLILVPLLAVIVGLVVWLRRRTYYEPEEYEDDEEYEEYEEYEEAGETPETAEPVVSALSQPEPEPAPRSEMVALNELFPSLGDARMIDIRDDETHHLVSRLIEDEVELARIMLAAGQKEEARIQLQDLRAAAQRMGLLGQVVNIDDLLID